jgi:hypothetical protein
MCVSGVVVVGSIEFRADFFFFFVSLAMASTLSSLLEYDLRAKLVDIHIVVDRRVSSLDADAIQSALARIFAHVVAEHRRQPHAVRWSVAGSATMQSVFDVAAWYKFCASLSSSIATTSRTDEHWPTTVDAVADVIQALCNEALVSDDALIDRRAIVVVVAPLPDDIECVSADAVQDEIDEPLIRRRLMCESANARVLFLSCGQSNAMLSDAVAVALRRHLRGVLVRVADVADAIAAPPLWSTVPAAAKRLHIVGWTESAGVLASVHTDAHPTMGAGAVLSDEWAAVAAIALDRVTPLFPHCAQFACVKASSPGAASFAALLNSLLVTNKCLLLAARSERAVNRHLLLTAASGGVQAVAFVVPAAVVSSHECLLQRARELSDGVLASLRRLPSSVESRNAVLVVKKLTRAEESLFAPNRVTVLLPTVEVDAEPSTLAGDEADNSDVALSPVSIGSPNARRRSLPRAVVAQHASAGERLVTLYIGTLCGKLTDMRNDVLSILECIDDESGNWSEVLRDTLLRDATALRAAHERQCSVLVASETLNTRQCVREAQLQCLLRLESCLFRGAHADPPARALFDELCQLLAIYCFRLDSESPDGCGFRVWLAAFAAPYLDLLPRTMRGLYAHFELDAPDEIRKTPLPYDLQLGSSPQAAPAGSGPALSDVIRHMSLGKNRRKREAERNVAESANKTAVKKRANVVLVGMPSNNQR